MTTTQPTIENALGASITLRSGDDELELCLDLGDFRVSGLAGPGPVCVGFSEYVELDNEPPTLAFLRTHDVVAVEYVNRGRRAVGVGARLQDAVFKESMDGSTVIYSFRCERLDGNLFGPPA